MKKFKGFSTVGAIVALAIIGIIAVGTYIVIDGNNKATKFEDYDFYSVIAPDSSNGQIGDHVKGDKNAPTLIFEYADYITNEEGVYPVTEDLKIFLQKFSVSQRYFSDGNGWAETTAEDEIGYRLYSSEEDQWLFACCYYS